MSNQLFRTFMQKRKLMLDSILQKQSKPTSKALSSIIQKQAPPGPPPRPGLKWKPSTHRWIIDQSAHTEQRDMFPSDHPVHRNPDKPYLTSDISGLGFDLHEGQEVTYENYPTGRRIPGVIKHDDENGWIIEATGWWRQHFNDQDVSDFVPLGGGEGLSAATNLSEFYEVKDDVQEIQQVISAGEQFGWSGEIPKRLEATLASIEDTIDYNSYETTQAGNQGETPLQILVDQLNGALESQHAFGGLQVGSWKGLSADVLEYIGKNTPDEAPEETSPPRTESSKTLERRMTADLDRIFSPEAKKKRAEQKRNIAAREVARSEAIRRNPGTDPSWYGR